jgi:hypothetical protein
MDNNTEGTRKPRSAAKKAVDLTAAILAPKVDGKRRGRPPTIMAHAISPAVVSKDSPATLTVVNSQAVLPEVSSHQISDALSNASQSAISEVS